MTEFRKKLTNAEIKSGNLCWSVDQDDEVGRVIPQTLVFDLIWEGSKLDHLAVEWEKHQLYIGEPLMNVTPGSELLLSSTGDRNNAVLQARLLVPGEKVIIRKRLSLNEFKHRYLKWFAREDDLYRRLLPSEGSFALEIDGKIIPGRRVDFEKRTLIIGESLRKFNPGETLIIHRVPGTEVPTLVLAREKVGPDLAGDATTSLRCMVARLISRPLSEFNEGEVKGLIALLDENKNLWERIVALNEENDKMKEQIATLENVFDQFSKNTLFESKRDFEEWVVAHLPSFEKGIRLIHRDYSVTWADGKKQRIDLLCQDRKGVLVVAEIVYNPVLEDLEGTVRMMSWLKQNIDSLGKELTGGKLKANSIRGLVISNREKPDLVELCLQNSIKLCVVNSGLLIDFIE